jgi:hypothetical protein
MKLDWETGFKRIRWTFLGISWGIFLLVQVQDDYTTPARFGEHAVYMLFFTGGCVLFARLVIWIIRGFLGSNTKVGG